MQGISAWHKIWQYRQEIKCTAMCISKELFSVYSHFISYHNALQDWVLSNFISQACVFNRDITP